jgi:hypothetical protein
MNCVRACRLSKPNVAQTASYVTPLTQHSINKVLEFLDIIHHPDFFKDTTFRRLDFVSVLRSNLLCWAQRIDLVLISGQATFRCKDGNRTQSPKRRVFEKVRTIDNVQESHYFNSTPPSQTSRFNSINRTLCSCVLTDVFK